MDFLFGDPPFLINFGRFPVATLDLQERNWEFLTVAYDPFLLGIQREITH